MKKVFNIFLENLNNVRSLFSLHEAIKEKTTEALDLSDILRSCIVLSVSALDHYIHEIVKIGLLEIVDNKRMSTPSSMRFMVPLATLKNSLEIGNLDPAEESIRSSLGWRSFQSSKKISEAIKLIYNENIWQEVSGIMNIDKERIKQKLDLIVDRRHKIAHEADLNPIYPSTKWPINESDTEDSIVFISSFVNALDKILS